MEWFPHWRRTKDSTVPVNISYKTGARPLLVVTNVLHDTLEWYDTSGGCMVRHKAPSELSSDYRRRS